MLSVFSKISKCVPKVQAVQTIKPSLFKTKLMTNYVPKCYQSVAEAPVLARETRIIGNWLITCSGMVVGAVVLGGITRITKSGLSMVDWHLFKEFPPMAKEKWLSVFEKYKEYPDYKQRESGMSLQEFKFIWWMEYLHRTWGRVLGGMFVLPASYFWYKGWLNKAMKTRVGIFGSLILFQGLLGWYMVKSGLVDKGQEVARVSHYRLTAHLGAAFVLYSLMLWSGLSHLLPPQKMEVTQKLLKFKRFAHGAKALVFITALSGAMVAGLEAGLVYNSFPKMGDRWIPEDILSLSPKLKNFTENSTTVQFDHRILAETVMCTVAAMWLYSRKLPLSPRARMAINTMFGVTCLQVALGITTLLTYTPKSLCAAHQSGALALLSSAIWLTHELKLLRRIPK